NLSANNYSVTVTDQNGCNVTTSVTIGNTNGPTLSGTQVNATCGSANGSIDLTVSGGTSPYTYNWSNASVSEDQNNLSASNYGVTVTDQNGCNATTSVTIGNTNGPTLSSTQINASCGSANGSIDLTVSGGATPYTYNWSNASISEDINNLSANNYSVTVSDQNGCNATTTVNIGNTNGPTLSTTQVNATCGSSNGSIDLTVSGGAPPYTYRWSNGSVSEDISNLSANNYSVTVSDQNGCNATTSVTIGNRNGPTLSSTQVNATCGSANGSIDLTVSGGTVPYTYSWSNASASEDINNLSANNYSVTVTD